MRGIAEDPLERSLGVGRTDGHRFVKVILNGKYEAQSVRLKKEAVDANDVEALEDLLLAAFNAARAKVEADSQEKLGGMTKGLGI